VECPCCETRFRKFAPIPRTYEPDLECPRCGSYSRHRQLWLFMTRRLGVLSRSLTLLHVAPELFFYERLERAANLRYVSADLHVAHAAERIDIEAIPYPDRYFDAIICSHVLEHVVDDRAAMRELCRVLKDDGWAVIQAPVDGSLAATREDPSVVEPRERARRFGADDHVRMYGRDYLTRLEEAGFEVAVERFVAELDRESVELYGLLQTEDVNLCRKRAAAPAS
jgi:SAM-dependent methyltransferase